MDELDNINKINSIGLWKNDGYVGCCSRIYSATSVIEAIKNLGANKVRFLVIRNRFYRKEENYPLYLLYITHTKDFERKEGTEEQQDRLSTISDISNVIQLLDDALDFFKQSDSWYTNTYHTGLNKINSAAKLLHELEVTEHEKDGVMAQMKACFFANVAQTLDEFITEYSDPMSWGEFKTIWPRTIKTYLEELIDLQKHELF